MKRKKPMKPAAPRPKSEAMAYAHKLVNDQMKEFYRAYEQRRRRKP